MGSVQSPVKKVNWVLAALSLILHLQHQDSRLLRATWSSFWILVKVFWLLCLEFLKETQSAKSSAYWDTWTESVPVFEKGRSLTNMLKRSGLSTDPCGVPAAKLTIAEVVCPTLTAMLLSWR